MFKVLHCCQYAPQILDLQLWARRCHLPAPGTPDAAIDVLRHGSIQDLIHAVMMGRSVDIIQWASRQPSKITA